MSRRSYKVTWDDRNPLRCVIHQALTDYFVLRGRETDEDRLARKDLEARSTPEENLRRLFRNHLDAQWRATELYDWFEKHAPGYQLGRSFEYDLVMIFAHIDHVILFKLTWL